MVGAKGFEPSTPWSQTKYSNQTELRPDTKDKKLKKSGVKNAKTIKTQRTLKSIKKKQKLYLKKDLESRIN